VRDSVGLMPVVAQLLRQLGELTGCLLGQCLTGFARL